MKDVPVWVDQFKALHYRGQISFRNSVLPQIPNEILLDTLPVDHGNGWMRVNTSVSVKYQNMGHVAARAAAEVVVSGRSLKFRGLLGRAQGTGQTPTGRFAG